jgi:ketosteroid isomerase-like protein
VTCKKLFVENPEERRNSDVGRKRKSPTEVVTELREAINQHDLDAMAACFGLDYESAFPAHPDRTFRGNGQMRKNWSQIFAAVPDIKAVLLSCVSDGDTVWAEWEWKGIRIDGSRHLMRGVTVQGVKQDRIAWVRLYMEPVQLGAGTDTAIREHLTTR